MLKKGNNGALSRHPKPVSAATPSPHATASYGSISKPSESSSSDTYIAVEACERTPLLLPGNGMHNGVDSGVESASTISPLEYKKTSVVICLNCRVITFLLMIVTSLALAAYLLWRESRPPKPGYTLNLIQHDVWSRALLPAQALLDASQVLNVFITHTASLECVESDQCLALLHAMQSNSGSLELNYNFLLGGDCQTYEARGWQYASGVGQLPQSSSLVLGLMGNFTWSRPAACQMQAAQALLWESVKRHRLLPRYSVYALRNVSSGRRQDAAALQQQLKQWPSYKGERNI